MKNYLVKSLYKIHSTHWHFKDRADEGDLFGLYNRANEHSIRTYEKFLQGDWEYKYYTGEFETINDAFYHTFWAIHDLWHSEPCNILYTDPDTLAIKNINPWHYDKFMMFNYTDPTSLIVDDKVIFEHFFNAGVRYFSHSMKPEVWGLGRHLAMNWDKTTYHTEQLILNEMLWSQKVKPNEILDTSMNWALFINMDQSTSEIFNNSHIDHAKILHFHGSRNIKQTVKIMDDFIPTFI
jgi:hypothetical protein